MLHDFLLEIGCEEFPTLVAESLSEDLKSHFVKALAAAQLAYGEVKAFATPRRVALLINDLAEMQPQQLIERKGPAWEAAFDKEGKPTQACMGFAKSCNVELTALQKLETDKGIFIGLRQEVPGKSVHELLPETLQQIIRRLKFKKTMHWGNYSFEFPRPVRWLVMLHGEQIIPAELFGVQSDRITYGHRVHAPGPHAIKAASAYETFMPKYCQVAIDVVERRKSIHQQLVRCAQSMQAEVVLDEELLNEVTSIVEWPHAQVAHFDPTFLRLPEEVLITVMKHHQKCFALRGKNNKLIANFIFVANLVSEDPQQVAHGNERVMKARLSDAMFFYEQDLATGLDIWCEQLSGIDLGKGLGTMADKVARLQNVCKTLALLWPIKLDQRILTQLITYAKADLATGMVGELPELQGIMGSYYTNAIGLPEAVSEGVREHYLPRFANDNIPQQKYAVLLSLADRIDTITGYFKIGEEPTGSSDPLGLRRLALAVVRILIANKLEFSLENLLTLFIENTELVNKIVAFILERQRMWHIEQGLNPNFWTAVIQVMHEPNPFEITERLHALSSFQKLPQAQNLVVANKRIQNILKDAKNISEITDSLFQEDAERKLYDVVQEKKKILQNMLEQKSYNKILLSLADLQPVIDHFFDKVMVMHEDVKIRQNRLALLQEVQSLFFTVADISQLAGLYASDRA